MSQYPSTHRGKPDRIRPAREIAARTLALFGIVGIGLRAPREDVIAWLKETGAWHDLSARELSFVEAPATADQCDTSIFQRILPPYAEISEEEFVETATRRSDEELLLQAETCMNLHAEYRAAARGDRQPRLPVDGGIIQERHHAINWVIGYEGLAWDFVTTDT